MIKSKTLYILINLYIRYIFNRLMNEIVFKGESRKQILKIVYKKDRNIIDIEWKYVNDKII